MPRVKSVIAAAEFFGVGLLDGMSALVVDESGVRGDQSGDGVEPVGWG
jgi:hypothetical protein